MYKRVKNKKWLLLPIETKARELHGKFLQACVAAENNVACILGSKAIKSRQNALPNGIFIEKSISPGRMKNILNYKKNGNRTAAWCEEGLIYYTPEDYCSRRVEKESFENLSYYFAWGDNQARDIASFVQTGTDKIILAGNPRFDILRPEFRDIYNFFTRDISEYYKKFILINTKFGVINSGSFHKSEYIERMRTIGKLKTKQEEEFQRLVMAEQEANMQLFVEALPALSTAFPHHTIIVRPHPSEIDQTWIDAAKGLTNVQVVYERSAVEWIYASEVLIHYNCTTGVEAFMLDKPSICYRLPDDGGGSVKSELVDRLSNHARNIDELIDMVSIILRGEPVTSQQELEERKHFASRYIANMPGNPLASETIVKSLKTLDLPEESAQLPLRTSWKQKLSSLYRKIMPSKFAYSRKKFPGLSQHEVQSLLETFQKATGRFADVKAVQVCENVFCVYKE